MTTYYELLGYVISLGLVGGLASACTEDTAGSRATAGACRSETCIADSDTAGPKRKSAADSDPHPRNDEGGDTATDTSRDPGSGITTRVAQRDSCDTQTGPVIRNLVVEDNPNSVLSCYVTWETDAPATSEVYYGDLAYSLRVADDTPSRRHRVLLIGMHADTRYRIKVVSRTDAPEEVGSAKASFTTAPLPDLIPEARPGPGGVSHSNASWTLTNIHDYGSSPRPPAVIVMYDDHGKPVWYFIDGTNSDSRGDIDARLIDGGRVLIGATRLEPPREIDLAGDILWEGPPQLEERLHHHFDKTDAGHYIGIRGRRVDDLQTDYVQVFTPELETVWEWHLLDHMTPAQSASGDWSHSNSVTLDEANAALYLSCRNLDAIFKIDLSGERDIIWRLGKGGDFEPDPDVESPWFRHEHDPEIQENGNVLVYDNGSAARPHSRVIEYALDEETLQSEVVFEFPGDFEVDAWYRESWYTPIWGDADRLENGNLQVAAGTRTTGAARSRIFEIAPDGEVVRELRFPRRGGRSLGIYRAQRIPVPPHVEILCDPAEGCALDGCAASGGDFDPAPGGNDTPDAGTDTGSSVAVRGADTGSVPETDPPLFPMEWRFESDWDGFQSEQFVHNPATGALELDYTFTGVDDPTVVAYRELHAADWTGVGSIDVRLRSLESSSGGYTIVFRSGYAWSWCSTYMDHPATTEWTVVSLAPNAMCQGVMPEMAQDIGVIVEPGDDAVFPMSVRVAIDSVTVNGTP